MSRHHHRREERSGQNPPFSKVEGPSVPFISRHSSPQIPRPQTPAEVVNKWLNSNPSAANLAVYVRSVAAESTGGYFTNQYSRSLVERLVILSDRSSSAGHTAQTARDSLQKVVFSEFDRINRQNLKIEGAMMINIIHACSWLAISHPVLNKALISFHIDRKTNGISKPHADMDLLVLLGRRSDLTFIGATNSFLKILELYKKGIVTGAGADHLELKRLYASILAVNPADVEHRGLIGQDSRGLKPGSFTNSSDVRRVAMICSFSNGPDIPLPFWVEHRLRAANRQFDMERGKTERWYEPSIKAGILKGLSSHSAVGDIRIKSSVNLPFEFGPYNSDFSATYRRGRTFGRIAVEINGSTHYSQTEKGPRLSGADQLKRNILGMFRIPVAHVPNTLIQGQPKEKIVRTIEAQIDSLTRRS